MSELLDELREHYRVTYGSSDIAQDDLDGKHVIVIECQGEQAGMIAVHVEGETVTASRLYVRPAHRGHGHARTLIRGAIAHARSHGAAILRGDIDHEIEARVSRATGARPVAPYGAHADDPTTRCIGVSLSARRPAPHSPHASPISQESEGRPSSGLPFPSDLASR